MTVLLVAIIGIAILATYQIAGLLQTHPFTRYETISLAYLAGIIDSIGIVCLVKLVLS